MDLSHTPGILYALAYWSATLVYVSVNTKRHLSSLMRFLTPALGLVGLVGFMVSTDGINSLFFVPCILLDVAMIFAIIYHSCEINWRKAVYFTARAFMLGEFAASLCWQMYYFLWVNHFIPYSPLMTLAILSVTFATVFPIMYLLERKNEEENHLMDISSRELTMVSVLTLSVFIVSNLSYVYTNTPFSSNSTAEIFIIRTLVDLGGVGILYANHMQQQSLNRRIEVEYLQKLLHMQYDNYRISEESIALINQKYHDLKHQVALLRSEIGSSEKLKYLDRLESDIRSYEAQNKTGNQVLDTILTARSLQCQHEDISLTCTADGHAIDFLPPMDISALFGNAIDNAIESVRKLEDKEKRLIHLSISRQKGFVRILMENYFEGDLHFVNGIPATSKENRAFHGFGVKSMQRIVEQYGGSLTIRADNHWFELRILLPQEQDQPKDLPM